MKTSNPIRPFVLVLLLAVSLCAQQGVNVTKVGNVAVSLYDTIFNATSATATQTSSAVRVPGFSGYGAFSVVFAGLTGSPAGCQFAFEYQQNTGTAASAAFFTQAVTPSSSYQSFTVSPSAGFNAGDNVIVVYSCGTYPTAGTMTLTYNPTGQGPIPAGTNVIGHVIDDSGSTTAVTGNVAVTKADGSDVTLGAKADAKSTATDTTAVTLMQVLKEISAMEQAPASRAVTNAGTFAVQAGLPTTVDTNSGVKSASTLRVVLATDQPALTNKLLVTPDSVALPANQSVNVNQLAGTTADTNSGVKSAGTLRVVLATDQPALTNKLLVTPDSVALPANQSVNVSQVNGVTPLMGNGTTGTGSQRVTIASDNTAFSVNAAGTLTDNNAAPSSTNVGAMPCMARTDLRAGTAATAGRLIFPDCGTDGLQHVAALPDLSMKRYRASSKFAASSTTDNWRISGNASNTVIVTKLTVTCTETTAGQVSVQLIKRSTAGSGGTAASVTAVPLDSNKAAASSVVNSYTGTGPTVGTLVGDLDDAQFGCMAAATASPNDVYIPVISPGAPLAVLRGTAEGIALNFGGAITGGNLTVSVEWAEVTTITP